jgi:hypothetical protein
VRRFFLPLLGLWLAAVAAAQDHGKGPAALREVARIAWSFSGVTLEGPPLAAGAHVLVHGREASGRRALVALEPESGRVLARTLFSASASLDPVASGERVLVRAGPGRLELLRWRGVRFVVERSFQSAQTLSRPAFEGEELYLRQGDALVRHDLARREPSWSTPAELLVRGAPALCGEDVFALAYDARGEAQLCRFARTDGRLLERVALGSHADGLPAEGASARIYAHPEQVFVELPAPVRGRGGGEYVWTRVPREARFGAPTLHHFAAEPLARGAGWVAPLRESSGVCWIRAPENQELAGPEHHAWLAQATAPAAAADDVLYLGPCAAEENTHLVLWRRADPPDFAPLPLAGRLLVVERGILRCLAGPEAPREAAGALARERAQEAEAALAQRLLELGGQALRARDDELASAWIDEAEALGAQGRALEVARAELERSRTAPQRAQPDARRLATLRTEEARVREALLTRLLDDARSARASERRALLAELFARAPRHEGGQALLAALLPAGAALAPGEAGTWLDYLRVSERLALDFTTDAAAPLARETRLAAERAAWRADVALFTSPQIALVTAGTEPGHVAEALRSGEHVVSFLEQIFGAPRAGSQRLDVLLYPTREEYLAASAGGNGGFEGSLEWTGGHFDLGASVSRLFVSDDAAQRARLAEVQAHELTHHWLAMRSSLGPVRASAETSGYWIVEGIALWVEERVFDSERGLSVERRTQADSLDTLAAMGAPLLPWPQLCALSYEDYRALETRPTAELPLAWRLGMRTARSPMHFFYAQAGGLAHFLWEAEDGAYRSLLIEAVRAYYAGTPLDIARATGLAPAELGARVLAFARDSLSP